MRIFYSLTSSQKGNLVATPVDPVELLGIDKVDRSRALSEKLHNSKGKG